MTLTQQIITIALLVLGTVITRFLPFIIFRADKPTPKFVSFLGKYLPPAIFSMLVVYCLKSVNIVGGSHGLPELIAIAITVGLHLWKRQTLLSIGVGTVSYMLLIQFLFK